MRLYQRALSPPRVPCMPSALHLRYSSLPMHDLEFFRTHLDRFAEMARSRNLTLDLDAFRSLDSDRRHAITAVERLKADRNQASEEIARTKKTGQDSAPLIARMKEVSETIRAEDQRIAEFDARLR